MISRILSICALALVVLGCSSTKSVYNLSDQKQRGVTYQVYEQAPDEMYDSVRSVLENAEFSDVDNGWEIRSSAQGSGVIKTEWKEVEFSQKADGSSWPSLRYKIKAIVKEADGGSRVEFRLSKERRIMGNPDVKSPWRQRTINKEDANEYLRPLFESLDASY